LIDTIYTEIRQLVIGKRYSSIDLAYYNRGRQFPFIFVNNVNVAIDSVLLPAMSKEQDDSRRVKNMTRRAIQVSTYVMAPLMMGLVFIGEPLVCLLLTEKWLPCVKFMRIFCISFMFYPIHTANLNAIKSMGRSDLFLKLEIVKKVIGTVVLLITMWISVEAMAYSLLFTSVTAQIINSWPNRKLLGYKYEDQLKDILPSIVMAVLMGMLIYFLSYLKIHISVIVVMQVISGATLYIVMSYLLKIEPFLYMVNTIKSKKIN